VPWQGHDSQSDSSHVRISGLACQPVVAGSPRLNSNPTAGTHGFLSTEPKMNAIFVASGAGIKVGQRVKAVANVDVAPTMAHILGVSLKDASGRVLTECFAGAP
jgi:predicted AlkP superfamily pyrophosphatase or phosphodiesterase